MWHGHGAGAGRRARGFLLRVREASERGNQPRHVASFGGRGRPCAVVAHVWGQHVATRRQLRRPIALRVLRGCVGVRGRTARHAARLAAAAPLVTWEQVKHHHPLPPTIATANKPNNGPPRPCHRPSEVDGGAGEAQRCAWQRGQRWWSPVEAHSDLAAAGSPAVRRGPADTPRVV